MLRPLGGTVARLLHIDGTPILVRALQRRDGAVRLQASGGDGAQREEAVERMRFALGVDDDYAPFYRQFKRDRLLGGAVRRKPWHRPLRRPFAWEALAWAVTKQLIESSRAAEIQRRIVRRWGPKGQFDDLFLRDVPTPQAIARCAPAELQALDLSAGRSLALIRAAAEVAAGRVDPADRAGDTRLLAIREIGPWTVQCLGLYGRGELDSLPAGDLGYLKLVGRLTGLGRRATIEEVEEFFARYEPYRGLAGDFLLHSHGAAIAARPPLRLAA